MAIHKLSPNFVEAVSKQGLYSDGGGLYAQVGEGGETGSWIFRYRYNGRQRYMGLGSFNTIGLAQRARWHGNAENTCTTVSIQLMLAITRSWQNG